MAPCTPSDNTLNPIVPPPIPVPGFGLPFSPIQIPLPDFDLPTELLEDLMALVQQISAIFPSGIFKANPDFGMKNVLDFIANILSQIAPFLSFYNFIMALLRLVVCIIEVLCAIPNPFAIAQKLKVLFTECLPPFLNLFPFLALIIMIISLLLLILALIEYIIATILAVIEAIIKNLEILAAGITLADAQSTLAAAQKIANLLCFIQNLLAIFVALAAILAIIESLAKLAGFGICADGDEGCCPPELCPPFIKNTPDGIAVTTGVMKYNSQVGVDLTSIMPPELAAFVQIPPIREERWQLYDTGFSAPYNIGSIITPIEGNIFWPDEIGDFPADLALKRAPYTVDLTATVNPLAFGLSDGYGTRVFQIKDCVVVRKPYLGVVKFDNTIDLVSSFTGTLNIEGGLVFEADGSTPYLVDGEQATLNNFIHLSDISGTAVPGSDDTVTFNDVQFTWKPNAPALAGYQLTTVGCIPEVNVEKAVQNAILAAEGLDPVLDKLPPTPAGLKVPSTGNFLPNVAGATQCVTDAINVFRQDVSPLKAAEFQATIQTCLGDLRDQTLSTLCAALIAAVSQFKSTIELDTDVQFTTRPITVTVTLRDPTGTNLGVGIPQTCADQMADKLLGQATFGTISSFNYNGSNSAFDAQLTAPQAGSGTLTVSFDNKILSTLVPGVVGGAATAINETEISYQFVDGTVEPPVRRNATDVASDVS